MQSEKILRSYFTTRMYDKYNRERMIIINKSMSALTYILYKLLGKRLGIGLHSLMSVVI